MDEEEYRNTYHQINNQRCVFEKMILLRYGSCQHSEKLLLAEREAMACQSKAAQQHCAELLNSMRKTLTSVIKDTTPNPGMIHPLSENTVEDMKLCLSLISSREREITQEQGDEQQFRPRFVDEPSKDKPQQAQVIKFQPKVE